MGLAVRIIPTLLAKGTQLVKGRKFSADRVVGHVLQAARIHQSRGVDELIVLDVDATPSGRGPNFTLVEELTRDCFMPITIGGGVRNAHDVDRLLRSGADKVSVKTLWCQDLAKLEYLAVRFGCQAIVASLDCTYDYSTDATASWAIHLQDSGCGEILLTSMSREGTMEGYDLDLIRKVCEVASVPVIAHGGCSGPEDMLHAIEAGASAVAAGALFQFTEWTPRSCVEYLAESGVEVRL